MSEEYEYIIKQDGGVSLRHTTETELDVSQTVFDKMAEGSPRILRNAFSMEEWGIVHAAIIPGYSYITLPLGRLPLRAPFKMVGKKDEPVMVPVFSSKTDAVLSMNWEPDRVPDLRLDILISSQQSKNGNGWDAAGAWLFASSKDGNKWRLPLPNIHDNCAICEGEWVRHSDTLRGSVRATLDQFEKSQWNADLWKDPEKSQKFFRFTPKKDGFGQLDIDAKDWTKLCLKVSVDVTKYIIT